MSKKYYTLVVRYGDENPWAIEFGSFKRSEVKAEALEYFDGDETKILTTTDDQASITAAVLKLNGEKLEVVLFNTTGTDKAFKQTINARGNLCGAEHGENLEGYDKATRDAIRARVKEARLHLLQAHDIMFSLSTGVSVRGCEPIMGPPRKVVSG